MAARTSAIELARLLEASSAAIYALDDQRRIVFVNAACAAWTGCAASELVGLECRYHSSPAATGTAAVAAALAPPPAVQAGERATAVVALAASGDTAPRRIEFIPLAGDELEAAAVLAVAEAASAAAEDDDQPREATPAQLHEQLRRFRRALSARYNTERLLGESEAMRQVRAQVQLAAQGTASVSIVGPVGSGRQHVARAIHYGQSAETSGALVPLACPLLSAELLESTIRALARAQKSTAAPPPATLQLNDVEDSPAEALAALVRATPLSGVRVVSTARESLAVLAARGDFPTALASRLATLEIRLPPLAARLADLPLLAQMFLEDQNRRGTKQLGGFSAEALDRLASYAWPGNVDELADVVAQAHARAQGPLVAVGDLPAVVHLALDAAARPRRAEQTIVLEEYLARVEVELISRALRQAKGNKAKAARLLGMTRPRLYRRLVQLGLEEAPP